jgi:hypothetical protein
VRGCGIAGGLEMRVLLAVCFAIAMNAVACAEGLVAWGKGAGSGSCAKYAQAYRSAPDHNFYLSWALGYMSGINSSNKDAFFDLNANTPEEMMRYLRQYCDANPLADYEIGVRHLLNTLPVYQRDKK